VKLAYSSVLGNLFSDAEWEVYVWIYCFEGFQNLIKSRFAEYLLVCVSAQVICGLFILCCRRAPVGREGCFIKYTLLLLLLKLIIFAITFHPSLMCCNNIGIISHCHYLLHDMLS